MNTTIYKYILMHAEEQSPTLEEFHNGIINYARSRKADGETCLILGAILSLNFIDSVKFIDYVTEHWKEWTLDIVNREYRHIKMAETVYKSYTNYEWKGE